MIIIWGLSECHQIFLFPQGSRNHSLDIFRKFPSHFSTGTIQMIGLTRDLYLVMDQCLRHESRYGHKNIGLAANPNAQMFNSLSELKRLEQYDIY
jgi:hypothetical protein